MKLFRFLDGQGVAIPALLDSDGTYLDLRGLIADLGPQTFETGDFSRLSEADLGTAPKLNVADLQRTSPIAQPRNIWCIGLNYSDHAEEAGMDIPKEPILFSKAASTFCGPNDNILYSKAMTKLDWEVELGVVIGKTAFQIAAENVLDHVAGYTIVNDVSERAWQLERGGQWVKGKSFPNFCPTGPALLTPDEIADVNALSMWLDVNGERMQSGSTAKMIFDVPTIIHHLSQFIKLEAGDLICTGTPPGVGMGQTPPRYLKVGDTVTLGIEGFGQQEQTVVPL